MTRNYCKFFKIKCKQCKGTKKLNQYNCIYCLNGTIDWCERCQRESSKCKKSISRPFIDQFWERFNILSLNWITTQDEYDYIACNLFSPLVFKISEEYYTIVKETIETNPNINIGFEVYNKEGDLMLIVNSPISYEIALNTIEQMEKINGT